MPCGRIYPLILITVEDKAAMYPLALDRTVDVDALLTYKFSMTNEGYTAATPNEPIVIRFEYPRKPDWADIKVVPDVIQVDVANPTMVKPDPSTPTAPQAEYEFTIPITVSLTLTGQAILRDGYDFHKLLVFAKSSESGLYQSGYGIKEFRVVPEGAIHESDVAGTQDVFTATPLPALTLAPAESSFAGTRVSLAPPTGAKFWQPAALVATIEPAPSGRMVFAVHDEEGALVASTAPLAAAGEARLNATFVKPGRHTATLTLLPDAGTSTPPLTYALPFDAGTTEAEGHLFPKSYLVTSSEIVPVPLASGDDAMTQFERDVPFFAFDTAQSVSASLTLHTAGALPADLGRSAANLQFSVHDPDGNLLSASSVDPVNPAKGFRVGSLPMDGWYVLRVRGSGAPAGTAYDARIEVSYASAHQSRNRADGAPDLTGGLLGRGGTNMTLPVDALAVWAPSDATPALDSGAARRYQLTLYDANGTLAYASGAREGAASFSAPAPGLYRAYAYAEPVRGDVPFSPIVRAFTFEVGIGTTTIASTFTIDDGYEAPFAATPTLLGFHAVPVHPGSLQATLENAVLIDAAGNEAEASAPGTYFLRAMASGDPPQGSEHRVSLEQSYPAPVTLGGPDAPTDPATEVPAPALGFVLLGLAALALARRR